MKKSVDNQKFFDIIVLFADKTAMRQMLMRIGVMAAQQTLTLLVEVRVLYP